MYWTKNIFMTPQIKNSVQQTTCCKFYSEVDQVGQIVFPMNYLTQNWLESNILYIILIKRYIFLSNLAKGAWQSFWNPDIQHLCINNACIPSHFITTCLNNKKSHRELVGLKMYLALPSSFLKKKNLDARKNCGKEAVE